MDAIYFTTPAEFRQWLEENHHSHTEVIVGFYKKTSGITGITWAEAVDEALCYGWIDSVGKRVNDERYTIRFTPRKNGSIWSNRNVERVRILIESGRMQPAGLRAYEARSDDRTGVYSFERDEAAQFSPKLEQLLQENAAAAEFFDSQAPWYRRAATHWVMSAKREDTRERRMNQLVEDSASGRTIKPLTRNR